MLRPFPTTPEGWKRFKAVDAERLDLGRYFVKRMQDEGLSEKELAEKSGCSRGLIQHHVALVFSAPELIHAAATSEFSWGILRWIVVKLCRHHEKQRTLLGLLRLERIRGNSITEEEMIALAKAEGGQSLGRRGHRHIFPRD